MASQSGAHGFPGKPTTDFQGASTFEPRLGAVGGASAMAVLQGPSWYVPAFPASLANSLCEWTIWNMQFPMFPFNES